VIGSSALAVLQIRNEAATVWLRLSGIRASLRSGGKHEALSYRHTDADSREISGLVPVRWDLEDC